MSPVRPENHLTGTDLLRLVGTAGFDSATTGGCPCAYRGFRDLILPSKNGTTQIDHLLVSPCGVFIVETKSKKGWIFGDRFQNDSSGWLE